MSARIPILAPGTVRVLEPFPSSAEQLTRTVRVWLPDDPRGPLGVVYLQDGQNAFDHPTTVRTKTWRANHAFAKVDGWMCVAIDHGPGRFEEYVPWPAPPLTKVGRADAYVSFLVDELKPWIDANFPTDPSRERTAIVGSSLGAMVSLHAARTRPDVFSRVGALSPTVMWGKGRVFEDWDRRVSPPLRLWVDVGGHEQFEIDGFLLDYPVQVPRFAEHLRGLGYGDDDLRFVLDPKGHHDEVDWGRRLPDVLEWLLESRL